MDKYERFEQWLRENGARFELLELREYDCGDTPSSANSSSSRLLEDADEEKKEAAGVVPTSSVSNSSHHGSTESADSSSSEMRGVHAVTHIPPNTVLMSIPRRCLITVEMGQATPIGQAVLHNSDQLDLDAPKHIFLMIYILWDKAVNGRNSFFYPYYEILPRTLSNMPIFWTPEELSELEGSFLLQQIADRNQAIADDYHAICQIAPLERICTLDEFKWARMCVCSRNFGLSVDGHRTSAMVPHADMLNHYRPRETKWTFDEDRQAFTITSLQHVPAGSQVYDSYGQKCNHRFLLNYGFAVEHNRELDDFCPNEVPMELYVDPDDALFSEKLDFWTRGEPACAHVAPSSPVQRYRNSHCQQDDGPNSNNQQQPPTPVVKRVRVCVSNNENTRLLFSLLRTLVCNAEELDAIRSTPGGSGAVHQMMNTGGSNSTTTTTDSVTRALFGYPPETKSTSTRGSPNRSGAGLSFMVPTAASSQNSSSGYHSGIHPHQYRSCRDVRHPISLRNERAAMQLLLTVVSRHLSLYPTTLTQDVNDLLDERAYPRFSNKRHAKIQVRGEKQVLHHFATWAQTALNVLDILEGELQQEEVSHGGSSVEVKLTPNGGHMVTASSSAVAHPHLSSSSHASSVPLSFDQAIRRLEEDDQVHHTILRYCADVLGSLRREEMKHLRRLQHANHTTATAGTGRAPYRYNSQSDAKSPSGSSGGSRSGSGRGGFL